MPRHTPPNPYREIKLGELADALMRRAGELLDGTQVGRRDTAYMLIRASHTLRPDQRFPNSPGTLAKTNPAAAAERYIEQFEHECRALRGWIVGQATDALLPAPTEFGPLWAYIAAQHHRALESDEACAEVLRAIAADRSRWVPTQVGDSRHAGAPRTDSAAHVANGS